MLGYLEELGVAAVLTTHLYGSTFTKDSVPLSLVVSLMVEGAIREVGVGSCEPICHASDAVRSKPNP